MIASRIRSCFAALIVAVFYGSIIGADALLAHSSKADSFADKTVENNAWSTIEVTATPHRLRLDKPADATFQQGRLLFRGGLHLTSDDTRFGGFSGLHVSNDGTKMLALSDRASWLQADLVYNTQGRLAGLSNSIMARLVDKKGDLLKKKDADSEGLDVIDDHIIVSFERTPRLVRYIYDKNGKIVFKKTQADLSDEKHLKTNKSLEGVTYLSKKRLLTSTERVGDKKFNAVYLIDKKDVTRIKTHRTDFFDVTGIEALGETLYILERHYSRKNGLHVRLAAQPLTSLLQGNKKKPPTTELARFNIFQQIDNFEGLAVRRDKTGRTFLYIISDDNFSDRQKTLLLMFELIE